MEANKNTSQEIKEAEFKSENDLIKSKLTEKFGMKDMQSGLDPESENEWLNYIYEWEKQFAERKRISVFDRLGKPEFIKHDKLRADEVTIELDRLLDLMHENSLALDSICEYDDRIIYKFLTEELFQEDINDIRIEGMFTSFIYEEFHPNHEYDIRELTNDFFDNILAENWNDGRAKFQLADKIQYNGQSFEKNDLVKELHSFREEVHPAKLELLEFSNLEFDIEKKTGTVEGGISFSVLENGKPDAHVSAFFKLNLSYNDYYWEICGLNFPEIQ